MAEVNKEEFKPAAYQISTDITQPKQLKDREKERQKEKRRREREDEDEKPAKKSLGSKIAARFLAIDQEDVKNHLLYDWLFPEIIDMVSNLLSQIFMGNEHSGRVSSFGRSSDGHVPYDKKYKSTKFKDKKEDPKVYVLDGDFRHIRLGCDKRRPLLEVLDALREEIQRSDAGIVFVKDLFSHQYINAVTNFTMGEWGWEDLEDNTDLIVKSGSWELELPPAKNYSRRRS